MKILLLDHNKQRLDENLEKINSTIPDSWQVDALEAVTQEEFEGSLYNIILVHKNNKECDEIEEGVWKFSGEKAIIFSGGYSAYYETDDGIILCPVKKLIDTLKKIIKDIE